jgi:hypothetical protein
MEGRCNINIATNRSRPRKERSTDQKIFEISKKAK